MDASVIIDEFDDLEKFNGYGITMCFVYWFESLKCDESKYTFSIYIIAILSWIRFALLFFSSSVTFINVIIIKTSKL